MDLIDQLRELALRIAKIKDSIQTEEATKNAMVMPFIQILGYNVFDPLEVTPELIADVGTKKGEKVDYAILREGKPIILFECKKVGSDLNINHASQLFRYFHVTEARFGVLTNGITYHFFTLFTPPLTRWAPIPFANGYCCLLVFDIMYYIWPLPVLVISQTILVRLLHVNYC